MNALVSSYEMLTPRGRAMTLRERIAEGTNLRLGEYARYLGYSREHLRKLADAGVLQTVRPDRPRSQRSVSPEEAERFARQERRGGL